MKRHLYEQIFRRQISTRPELKRLLLAGSTVLVCEIARETEKKKKKKKKKKRRTLYRTRVTTKQIQTRSVSRLNRLC